MSEPTKMTNNASKIWVNQQTWSNMHQKYELTSKNTSNMHQTYELTNKNDQQGIKHMS